jgi:FkbH-like protein
MRDATIPITANFTAEPLQEPLSFLLRELGLAVKIEFAPYNQIFQQLLDPSSICRSNREGINVVLIRLEDWARVNFGDNGKAVIPSHARESLNRTVAELITALKSAAADSAVPYVVVICPTSLAVASESGFPGFLREMENYIASELETVKGVYSILPDAIAKTYPVNEYDDPEGSRLGHIPYTELFFSSLAAMIARRIYRLRTTPHKVIALDCDQTLWRGVCGEDGALGIEIDAPRRALQEFMVNQHKSGKLLCLCSKNNEQDVFDVFECRPEMPLKRDHILSSKINWQPKSENLRALAGELNLGLNSFIFVDDDPAVCAEVRANCPEILTLHLPQDPAEIPKFLEHVWAFDHLEITAEDQERTSLYRVNAERDRLRTQSQNLGDFLSGLCLEITISPLTPELLARASQLTQRTNQFNFTTIRRSELEIRQLCEAGAECLVVNVVDRFGDYGCVGVMIFHTQKNALEVDTFLLSCRALGRGVEHRMLAHLGALARERKIEHLNLGFFKTEKNRPAFEFISRLDTDKVKSIEGGTIFRIPANMAAELDIASQATSDSSRDKPAATEGAGNSVPSGSVSESSAFLARVPIELSTPRQISAALGARKSKSRAPGTELVTPQNEVEEKLKRLWEEVLRCQPIGVLDNYFDLGGDSFQAVRIFSEIERNFDKHLALVTLLEAPTIRQLSEIVRGSAGQKAWSSLVPLRSEGSRPPFYCMHAAGGNVLFYRDLARHLGSDQPLYGLQARGADRTQTNHDSVEEMAEFYLDEIRSFQPEGPYYLGGSSFGGLVAFEMARQLERKGQEVALLALFDTYGPGYPVRKSNSKAARLAGYWIHRSRQIRETLKLLSLREKTEYVLAKISKLRKKVVRKSVWRKNEIAIAFSSATGRSLPKDLQRNHKAINQALRNYKPQVYGGRLTLFRAANQPVGIVRDETLGWKGMALGGLEIYEVPGFHGAVTVDPHAKFLAEELTPCLLHAQQGWKQTVTVKIEEAHLVADVGMLGEMAPGIERSAV